MKASDNPHSKSDGPIKVFSSPWAQRALSLVPIWLLYIIFRHPEQVFLELRHKHLWWVIAVLVPAIPIMLCTSLKAWVWRVRINKSTIHIRSLSGTLSRPLSDIIGMERSRGHWVGGRLKLVFADQSTKIIPALVGDLDDLSHLIRSQLQKVDRSEITEL